MSSKSKSKAGSKHKANGKQNSKNDTTKNGSGNQNSKKNGNRKRKRLDKAIYEAELERVQAELVKLQEWVTSQGLRVCVLFEGRDAAGKGGAIKRIVDRTNPRVVKVVALGTPTEREKTQWYYQRYVPHLPAAGEIVLFDRSWYNRAGVEHVMGFCTQEEHEEFLRSCPQFEEMLINSGIILIKFWFSVSDEEQRRRFADRLDNPEKRWKLSAMDLQSRSRWVDYSVAKDVMFAHTDTELSPWWVVEADDKRRARLNCIQHLLDSIAYEEPGSTAVELPPIQDKHYRRPPIDTQTRVKNHYPR